DPEPAPRTPRDPPPRPPSLPRNGRSPARARDGRAVRGPPGKGIARRARRPPRRGRSAEPTRRRRTPPRGGPPERTPELGPAPSPRPLRRGGLGRAAQPRREERSRSPRDPPARIPRRRDAGLAPIRRPALRDTFCGTPPPAAPPRPVDP